MSGEEKRDIATEALHPLVWGIVHHLTALSETENNPDYLKKAKQIIDIIFDKERDEFIEKIYDNLK